MTARATVLGVLLAALPAHADDTKPWAEGISVEVQDRANELFAAANELFAKQDLANAVVQYRAALALWDHPRIRFNLAVTLIQLDRILEADEALTAALRFRELPFKDKPELYREAMTYRKLLDARTGVVAVSCTQAGATVSLDGTRWFTCPGTEQRRVLAGEHLVVGELADHLTLSQPTFVSGGETTTTALTLVPIDSLVTLAYPVRRWIPWTVTSAGAVVALAGLGVWFSGQRRLDDFEQAYADRCPSGCSLGLDEHRDLAELESSGVRRGDIGVTLMAVGGALTLGGAVWAVLNRPRRVVPTVEVAPARSGVTTTLGWQF